MTRKSFSNGNGPSACNGASAYNGPFKNVMHGWFCACHWCLNGVRA